MNRKNSLLPLMFAVIAGVIYFLILNMAQSSLHKASNAVTVAVANVDIPEGKVMQRNFITTKEIPSAYVQRGAFVLSKGDNVADIENLVTRVSISKDDQITRSSLASLSPDAGISLKVTPNYRAFILEVDNTVSNLVKPGDKVDILLTFEASLKGTTQKENMAATILQNILVLGVGSNLGQGLDAASKAANSEKEANAAAFSDRSVLSLALTPLEAQYLALAKEEGELTIIVRSSGDSKMYPMAVSSFSKLFSY